MSEPMLADRLQDTSDPWSIPLESLDPSEGTLWSRSLLLDYLKRLRQEDPVHWSPTGPTGSSG